MSASVSAGSKTATVRRSSRGSSFAAPAVAALVAAVGRPERRRGGRDLPDPLVQGRLVGLDLDDQGDAGLDCDVKMFF